MSATAHPRTWYPNAVAKARNSASLRRHLSRSLSCLMAAFALVMVLISPLAQAAADTRSLTYSSTQDGGVVARSLAAGADGRVFFANSPTDGTPASVGWIMPDGTISDSTIPLSVAEPDTLVVDDARGQLYVTHNRSESLTVIDLNRNTVARVMTGVPRLSNGAVLDPDSATLYVLQSKGLVPVNLTDGSVGENIAVSTEKYPSVRDAVYDSARHRLWIAEGRASVVTAIDTTTGTWLKDVQIPVGSFTINDQPLGGRPALLASDPVMSTLYVALTPTFSDEWTKAKILSINMATGQYIGEPIEIGDTPRDMSVDTVTHELIISNGFDNSVMLIDPSTWQVSQSVSFNDAGITHGTGSGDADVWALSHVSGASQVYVTHPYTSRISTLTLTGEAASPTLRDPAPGQGSDTDEPDSVQPSVWEGPSFTIAADGAAPADGSLTWGVSSYAQGWEQVALGENVTVDPVAHEFTFSGGAASRASDGTVTVRWANGFSLRPYVTLVPNIRFLIGNPELVVHPDGSGHMTAHVSYVDDKGKQSEYKRLAVATFAAGDLTVTGESQGSKGSTCPVEKVMITGTPEFQGRSYTDSSGVVHKDSWPAEFVSFIDPSMQAWWFTTGASLDGDKAPAPVKVSTSVLAHCDTEDSDQGGENVTPAPVPTDGNSANPSPTPSSEIIHVATATPSPAALAASESRTSLALTGATVLPIALVAIVLVGAGVMLRRRITTD